MGAACGSRDFRVIIETFLPRREAVFEPGDSQVQKTVDKSHFRTYSMPRWFDEQRGTTMAQLKLVGQATQEAFTLEFPYSIGDGTERYFHADDWYQDTRGLSSRDRALVTGLMNTEMILCLIMRESTIRVEMRKPLQGPAEFPSDLRPLQGSIDARLLFHLNNPKQRDLAKLIVGILNYYHAQAA